MTKKRYYLITYNITLGGDNTYLFDSGKQLRVIELDNPKNWRKPLRDEILIEIDTKIKTFTKPLCVQILEIDLLDIHFIDAI